MNHYETLGVPPTATNAEIRTAFHSHAKLLHPDVATESKEIQEEWGRIEEAYAELKTEEKRAAYDAKLFALAPKCKRCNGTGAVQVWRGFKAMPDAVCGTCLGLGKII